MNRADPTRGASALAEGSLLAHYRIDSMLGEGAMGCVYAAHDTALDRTVAVKVLRPELAHDEELATRFFREARAASRATHANLAHIYFVGEEGGRRYFAMEWVDGMTLQQMVEAEGPLDLARTVDVLVQAARGLAAAHAAGVVHRDVKPSNLILRRDGTLKVTDFGLAKSADADGLSTHAGTLVGTPHYMSPEQCRGEAAGPPCDVYALGLVCWFLLTGRPPFEGKALGGLLHDQIAMPLPPLAEKRPDLPPEVGRLMEQLTAKDEKERPASMEAVEALLEAIRPHPLQPASPGLRVAAFGIDLLTLFGAVGYVVGILALLLLDAQAGYEDSWAPVTEPVLSGVVMLLAFLFLLATDWAWGASLGKLVLGLRVVRADGLPARFRHLLPRYLLGVPALALFPPLSWGVAWVALLGLQAALLVAAAGSMLRPGACSLADRWTGTRVVVAERAQPPKG